MAFKRGFLGIFYWSLSGGTRYGDSRRPHNEEDTP